ncbi:MAG: hypothetical protein JJV96_02615 [Alphaproteobacteria bacterium]|nr:hypothetical protein [Alphaproteobacteria bacterium]
MVSRRDATNAPKGQRLPRANLSQNEERKIRKSLPYILNHIDTNKDKTTEKIKEKYSKNQPAFGIS